MGGLFAIFLPELSHERLSAFATNCRMPCGKLGHFLEIAEDTLSRFLERYLKKGLLSGHESECMRRRRHVLKTAMQDLFDGDKDEALEWLRSPVHAFGDRSPLEVAGTERGARSVLAHIRRLEDGVFA